MKMQVCLPFEFLDIIEDQIVGSQLKPLLCIVPNNAPQDVKYWIENLDPHYVLVKRKIMSSIKIKLCNNEDENQVSHIDSSTSVTAKLHFRKI